MQRNTNKKLQTLRKHKLVKPLKSLATIWILCFSISTSIYTNSADIKLNEAINSVGKHCEIIGISYYAIVLKKENKKQKHTTHITFIKTHIGQQTKHQLPHNIRKHDKKDNFEKNCMGPLNDEIKLQVDDKNNKTENLKNP